MVDPNSLPSLQELAWDNDPLEYEPHKPCQIPIYPWDQSSTCSTEQYPCDFLWKTENELQLFQVIYVEQKNYHSAFQYVVQLN